MKEIILDHPVVKCKISILRDKNTKAKEFRENVSDLAMLLCYEVLKEASLLEKKLETPVEETKGFYLEEQKYVCIPILRAGMGMLEGVIHFLPNVEIGHIGLYREKNTLQPVEYYVHLPKDMKEKEVLLLDPMLATGGSACDAISLIKERGAKRIKFLSILAAPEGLEKLKKEHEDVQIYTASVDRQLNESGYILPGLGDAGDRLFGS